MTALALKYLLPVAAVIALLFGVYELGSGHGYKSGYQVAWDTQQKTINNMSAADDKRNTQDNKVINQVEQAAPVAVAQVKQEVAAQQTQNVKIIREQAVFVVAIDGWSHQPDYSTGTGYGELICACY
jgi:hypothetical protein